MLSVRVYLEQSRTGLWSAILAMPFRQVTLRGYLNRNYCKAAAENVALNYYGRVPYFVED